MTAWLMIPVFSRVLFRAPYSILMMYFHMEAWTTSVAAQGNTTMERAIFRQATAQYARALRTMERIVFFSLEKRLALFLREESLRRGALSFRVTHEGIARCIGSSREVVTRMLNQFAGRGMVELGRGVVRIVDQKALAEALE